MQLLARCVVLERAMLFYKQCGYCIGVGGGVCSWVARRCHGPTSRGMKSFRQTSDVSTTAETCRLPSNTHQLPTKSPGRSLTLG